MNNAPSRYVIDTSAIIAMYREWYPRRVFPSLWGDIEILARSNKIFTVSKVVDELNPEHDEPFQDADQAVNNRILFNWILERLPTVEDVHPRLQIAIEVRGSEISASHRDWADDRESADPYVIAAAELLECSVISTETPKHSISNLQKHRSNTGQYPRKTSIPSMGELRGVQHTNLVGLFDFEKWRY